MALENKVKFTTQVDSETLETLRELARAEGRHIQALVDEALRDLIEKRKQSQPRSHVMAAYQSSHEKHASLYKKLAE